MVQRVLIIGVGRIGRTLANVIGEKGADITVSLWDSAPGLLPAQGPLVALVPSAELVLVCVPSWAVRSVLQEIHPHLQPTTSVVTVAKGIEVGSGQTMADVLTEVLGQAQPQAVLGGPMLAEAIALGHRGVGVVGSHSRKTVDDLRELFSGTRLEIMASDQPGFVALVGCLKNVYAFIVGLSHGRSQDPDALRTYFGQVEAEFIAAGQALGIDDETLRGPAGLGDFRETATNPSSHNVRCGQDSGTHGAIVCASEGTRSAEPIARRLEQIDHFPYLAFLVAVIAGKKQIATMDVWLQSARHPSPI